MKISSQIANKKIMKKKPNKLNIGYILECCAQTGPLNLNPAQPGPVFPDLDLSLPSYSRDLFVFSQMGHRQEPN